MLHSTNSPTRPILDKTTGRPLSSAARRLSFDNGPTTSRNSSRHTSPSKNYPTTTTNSTTSTALVVPSNNITTLVLAPRLSRHHHHIEPYLLLQRIIIPSPSRVWRAAITQASSRHGRVFYEIRSMYTELNPVAPAGAGPIWTGTSVVRRRYKDFIALHAQLDKLAKTWTIWLPSLPPKKDWQSLTQRNRTDPVFVYERRVALQLWLRYVCDHHVLRTSTALREFLWDFDTSAVTGPAFHHEMNSRAEAELWIRAVEVQALEMKARFGNGVVALSAMNTRVDSLCFAFHDANMKTKRLGALDGRLSRGKTRFGKALTDWASFELREAGQSFGFVESFGQELSKSMEDVLKTDMQFRTSSSHQPPLSTVDENEEEGRSTPISTDRIHTPQGGSSIDGGDNMDDHGDVDSSRIFPPEDFITSFQGQDGVQTRSDATTDNNTQLVPHTPMTTTTRNATIDPATTTSSRFPTDGWFSSARTTETRPGIAAPELCGALMDDRSLDAFRQVLKLWGEVLLPCAKASKSDPRVAAEVDGGKKRSNVGYRVGSEWTEIEGLRPAMLRDGAYRMVQDQIAKARLEQRRWSELGKAFETQVIQLSSLDSLDSSPGGGGGGGSSGGANSRGISATQGLSRTASFVVDNNGNTIPVAGGDNSNASIATLDSDLYKAQALFKQLESMGEGRRAVSVSSLAGDTGFAPSDNSLMVSEDGSTLHAPVIAGGGGGPSTLPSLNTSGTAGAATAAANVSYPSFEKDPHVMFLNPFVYGSSDSDGD